MICSRCHHTHEAHTYKNQDAQNNKNSSLMRTGECIVPECNCKQYIDPIIEIDEELL